MRQGRDLLKITASTAKMLVNDALEDQDTIGDKSDTLDEILMSIKNLKLIAQKMKDKLVDEMMGVEKEQPNSDIKGYDEEKYETVRTLAKKLHKTENTIYRYLKNPKVDIPFIKNEGRILFDKVKIQEWIEKGETKTPSEIRQGVRTKLFNLKRAS